MLALFSTAVKVHNLQKQQVRQRLKWNKIKKCLLTLKRFSVKHGSSHCNSSAQEAAVQRSRQVPGQPEPRLHEREGEKNFIIKKSKICQSLPSFHCLSNLAPYSFKNAFYFAADKSFLFYCPCPLYSYNVQ